MFAIVLWTVLAALLQVLAQLVQLVDAYARHMLNGTEDDLESSIADAIRHGHAQAARDAYRVLVRRRAMNTPPSVSLPP